MNLSRVQQPALEEVVALSVCGHEFSLSQPAMSVNRLPRVRLRWPSTTGHQSDCPALSSAVSSATRALLSSVHVPRCHLLQDAQANGRTANPPCLNRDRAATADSLVWCRTLLLQM